MIIALTNLCTAGIIYTAPGFGGAIYTGFYHSLPGMQVVLVLVVAFGVGLTEVLHLDLVLLPSSRITSLPTSGSIFIFTVSQSFLIITTVLLFLGGILTSLDLVQSVVNPDRTEVSGCSIAIMMLTTLCAAGIDPGFGLIDRMLNRMDRVQ